MFGKKLRRIAAGAGALAAALALAIGGVTAANAAMPETSGLIITKLEQGVDAVGGSPANGLEQSVQGQTTIAGVTFEAYAVTVAGTPGTNAWQQAVTKMTLAEAQQQLSEGDLPYRTGTTTADGTIVWKTGVAEAQGESLEQGLYLIRETVTPEGVVPSGDFLVALPLTDPLTLDDEGNYQAGLTRWLDTVYVYPKNARVDGTKTVENASAYAVGDTVTWTIDTAIPAVRDHGNGVFVATDRFDIFDTLTDAQLALAGGVDGVTVTTPAGLTKGNGAFSDEAKVDYFVVLDTATQGKTVVKVQFTAQGRAALAAELNDTSNTRVVVTLNTTIVSAGEIENSATVFPGGDSSFEIPPATVKYGSYALRKDSSDDTVADLSGAEFRVYLTEAAAKNASNTEYDAENHQGGYLTTAENPAGLWTTDTDGRVSVGGFRYSAFANGSEITDTEKQQTYWLVETKALQDHQLLAAPHPFQVTSTSGSVDTQTEIIVNQRNTNGFVLPLTGGTGTVALTVGGIALLAVVLIVARRRQRTEAAAN